MTIQEFIRNHNEDYDTYEVRKDWKGYKVYSIWAKREEGACIGYPQYALEKDGEIRLSSFEETRSIMGFD